MYYYTPASWSDSTCFDPLHLVRSALRMDRQTEEMGNMANSPAESIACRHGR
jgi:hypothetical protein